MKPSLIISTAAIAALAGCASTDGQLAKPKGESIGPGMVEFTEVKTSEKSREDAVAPWEPSPFYPAFSSESGSDGADRPEQDERVVAAERARGSRPMATRGSTGATAKLFFEFYSNTWSRADGSTCRFAPTCSGFGRQAIARHGVLGLVMTFGRLHRNHSDADFYDAEGSRLRDPVSLHTFWFAEPSERDLEKEPEIGAFLQVREAARLALPAPPEHDDEASD